MLIDQYECQVIWVGVVNNPLQCQQNGDLAPIFHHIYMHKT
jgi:hypothetical protein